MSGERAERQAQGVAVHVVLVVDDDPLVSQSLRDVCKRLGFESRAAPDGLAAIECLKESDIDLVLLDLNMPRLDGFGVLEHLRSHPNPGHPAVIIVTSVLDVAGRVRGTELGAIDFVEKPFRMADLERRVKRAIATVDLERHLRRAEDVLGVLRTTDPVTGVGTFAELAGALEVEFALAAAGRRPLSCVVLSDERYGKGSGPDAWTADEQRLHDTARLVRQVLRSSDRIFRVDAAELVVLLPGTPLEGARRAVDKIVTAMAADETTRGAEIVAAGAAYPHNEILQASALYRAANVTLAQARAREAERVAFFERF